MVCSIMNSPGASAITTPFLAEMSSTQAWLTPWKSLPVSRAPHESTAPDVHFCTRQSARTNDRQRHAGKHWADVITDGTRPASPAPPSSIVSGKAWAH